MYKHTRGYFGAQTPSPYQTQRARARSPFKEPSEHDLKAFAARSKAVKALLAAKKMRKEALNQTGREGRKQKLTLHVFPKKQGEAGYATAHKDIKKGETQSSYAPSVPKRRAADVLDTIAALGTVDEPEIVDVILVQLKELDMDERIKASQNPMYWNFLETHSDPEPYARETVRIWRLKLKTKTRIGDPEMENAFQAQEAERVLHSIAQHEKRGVGWFGFVRAIVGTHWWMRVVYGSDAEQGGNGIDGGWF